MIEEVEIYHNILWSKYKAEIFSELHKLATTTGNFPRLKFVQIAETESGRKALGGVQYESHRYPYQLLYRGSYEDIGTFRLSIRLFWRVALSRSKIIVLPGYARLEHWTMLFASIFSGKKIGVFCDSTAYDRKSNRLKARLKKFFFGRIDFVLAYGKRSEEYLLSFGVPKNRIFQPCQAAAAPSVKMELAEIFAIRESLSQKSDSCIAFLYVGRLSPEKSIDVLFEAFSAFSLAQPRLGSELRIVGAGPLDAILKKKSETVLLSPSAKITFVGPLNAVELAREYLSAAALVLPSKSEPWGLVVNEAFYYGCPAIVSSACGCVPEMISKNTGFVFEVGDATELAGRLSAVAGDELCGKSRAKNCRDTVDKYTISAAAEKILSGLVAIAKENK